MDRADFIHLVRLSEHASADDSNAYRRSVAAFAALGYAWVVGCLLLSAGLLMWVANAMLHGRFKGVFIGLVIAAGGLLWTSLKALWCRFDEPEGVVLQASDAPALFESLERISGRGLQRQHPAASALRSLRRRRELPQYRFALADGAGPPAFSGRAGA
jgi:hypothetical protein